MSRYVRFDKTSLLRNMHPYKEDSLAILNVLEVEVDIYKLINIDKNVSNIFTFQTTRDKDLQQSQFHISQRKKILQTFGYSNTIVFVLNIENGEFSIFQKSTNDKCHKKIKKKYQQKKK